jgi:hypothetical protein
VADNRVFGRWVKLIFKTYKLLKTSHWERFSNIRDDGMKYALSERGPFTLRKISYCHGSTLQNLSKFLFSHCQQAFRLHPPPVPNCRKNFSETTL